MPTSIFTINGVTLTRETPSISLKRDNPPLIDLATLKRSVVEITLGAGATLSERINASTVAITELAWLPPIVAPASYGFRLEDDSGVFLMEDSGRLLLEEDGSNATADTMMMTADSGELIG